MEGAILGCPLWWTPWLPRGVRRVRTEAEAASRRWDIFALTPGGCGKLRREEIGCELLLLPGECRGEVLSRIQMERAVTYGLSLRDSLTLSSLREPVLCVQRSLLRPDGGVVEPQEIPLRPLPAPAEKLMALLGLRLLV